MAYSKAKLGTEHTLMIERPVECLSVDSLTTRDGDTYGANRRALVSSKRGPSPVAIQREASDNRCLVPCVYETNTRYMIVEYLEGGTHSVQSHGQGTRSE
jgi:hypothetical protein